MRTWAEGHRRFSKLMSESSTIRTRLPESARVSIERQVESTSLARKCRALGDGVPMCKRPYLLTIGLKYGMCWGRFYVVRDRSLLRYCAVCPFLHSCVRSITTLSLTNSAREKKPALPRPQEYVVDGEWSSRYRVRNMTLCPSICRVYG